MKRAVTSLLSHFKTSRRRRPLPLRASSDAFSKRAIPRPMNLPIPSAKSPPTHRPSVALIAGRSRRTN